MLSYYRNMSLSALSSSIGSYYLALMDGDGDELSGRSVVEGDSYR